MAIGNPVRLYKDLQLGLAPHPVTRDVSRVTDVNAVKQSMKLLLMTSFYERLFHPERGSPLYRLLFEPIDPITTNMLKQAIERVIQNDEPRAQLISLDVVPYYDESAYAVTINFNIVGIGTPVTFSTILKRLR
jgi:phage baseplate assembly protein W